jgi:hypothetical protein
MWLSMGWSDTPLSTKVGNKFQQQVAVTQSVQLACGLRATEFVFILCLRVNVLTSVKPKMLKRLYAHQHTQSLSSQWWIQLFTCSSKSRNEFNFWKSVFCSEYLAMNEAQKPSNIKCWFLIGSISRMKIGLKCCHCVYMCTLKGEKGHKK